MSPGILGRSEAAVPLSPTLLAELWGGALPGLHFLLAMLVSLPVASRVYVSVHQAPCVAFSSFLSVHLFLPLFWVWETLSVLLSISLHLSALPLSLLLSLSPKLMFHLPPLSVQL